MVWRLMQRLSARKSSSTYYIHLVIGVIGGQVRLGGCVTFICDTIPVYKQHIYGEAHGK